MRYIQLFMPGFTKTITYKLSKIRDQNNQACDSHMWKKYFVYSLAGRLPANNNTIQFLLQLRPFTIVADAM